MKQDRTAAEVPCGTPVDRPVGRPAPERAEWEHLKRYGYAPGNYMTRCRRCRQIAQDVDEYAITCRPCAETMHEGAA